jgi:hypothetical protein
VPRDIAIAIMIYRHEQNSAYACTCTVIWIIRSNDTKQRVNGFAAHGDPDLDLDLAPVLLPSLLFSVRMTAPPGGLVAPVRVRRVMVVEHGQTAGDDPAAEDRVYRPERRVPAGERAE